MKKIKFLSLVMALLIGTVSMVSCGEEIRNNSKTDSSSVSTETGTKLVGESAINYDTDASNGAESKNSDASATATKKVDSAAINNNVSDRNNGGNTNDNTTGNTTQSGNNEQTGGMEIIDVIDLDKLDEEEKREENGEVSPNLEEGWGALM